MSASENWNNVLTMILAAGKGTRMKSNLPKVLQPICGRPMLLHLLDTLESVGAEPPVVVVGHGAEEVRAILPQGCKPVLQEDQLGTGHAVKVGLAGVVPGPRTVLVLCGDVPMLSADTLNRLIAAHRKGEHHMTILTARFDDPTGYGRIVRGEDGWVFRIVEQKDATSSEQAIQEINTGIYIFEEMPLREAILEIKNDNAQGEYYLTDVVESMIRKGRFVGTCLTPDAGEVMGLSNKADLAEASARMRRIIIERLMEAGVTIDDPRNTYIETTVRIEPDAHILPGVHLKGKTAIRAGSVIGPQVLLDDVRVGRGCSIQFSVCRECEIMDNTTVGPFAHIRPGSRVGSDVRIGNFVEIKKSSVGDQTRIAHLSYVGDAEVGDDVNVGAGTIFCNYDGVNKHKTIIGEKSFIGSNSTLVVPVEIGPESYIAAGSVITGDVPPDSLAIARGKMTLKPGWSKKRRIILDKGSE